MIWEIQTQRFSLPSSLGPELSRFWGNRTSVSHPPPPTSPFRQANLFSFFLFFLLFSLFLPGSLCCHRLSVLQWDAGNQSLVFSVLWPPRTWQTFVSPAGRRGCKNNLNVFFLLQYHTEKTLTLHVLPLASCFLFLHPESFSHYTLATTHTRTLAAVCSASMQERKLEKEGWFLSGVVTLSSPPFFMCVNVFNLTVAVPCLTPPSPRSDRSLEVYLRPTFIDDRSAPIFY